MVVVRPVIQHETALAILDDTHALSATRPAHDYAQTGLEWEKRDPCRCDHRRHVARAVRLSAVPPDLGRTFVVAPGDDAYRSRLVWVLDTRRHHARDRE